MDKETLFKAIQRREVVLWAGAGFSRYAGFAMGGGVVHHLFDTLSTQQQVQVRSFCSTSDTQGYPAMGLPAFANLFVTLHNGQTHALRREIHKLFSARPVSLKTHQQLAQIPFIEHIITTNYDSLFEQAYGTDKLHVVTSGRQLPYQDYGKTTLYKVHGSLENPDSLLITEDDYHTFYAKSDKALWAYIESLMVSRTLLFVGYGLEDSNVLGLFMKLLDALGGNMRNAYLVAPGLHPLNTERLARRNVTYIDSTGEKLVEELLQSLKDTTLPAARRGGIAQDHTAKFMRNLGLQPTFQTTDSGFEVVDVKPLSEDTQYRIDFSINKTTHDAFQQFERGAGGLALKIDSAQLLTCNWKVADINLGIDIKTMWVVRAPKWKKTVDIEFSSGLILHDVTLSVYGGEEVITLVAYLPRVVATVKIPAKKITRKGYHFNLTLARRQEYFDSVESGLEHSKLMQALGRGEAIICYENGKVLWQNGSNKTNMLLSNGLGLEKLMLAMQRIEKAFSIRFRRFIIGDEDSLAIQQLDRIVSREVHSDRWTGHVDARISCEQQQEISQILSGGWDAYTKENHKKQFSIAGWELHVAYQAIRHLVETKFRKLRNDVVRMSSGKKQIATYYEAQQQVIVLKQAIPTPLKDPAPIGLPDEISQHLLDESMGI